MSEPKARAFCFGNFVFRKPVSTPDQVQGELFRDHAMTAFEDSAGIDAHVSDNEPEWGRAKSPPDPYNSAISFNNGIGPAKQRHRQAQ